MDSVTAPPLQVAQLENKFGMADSAHSPKFKRGYHGESSKKGRTFEIGINETLADRFGTIASILAMAGRGTPPKVINGSRVPIQLKVLECVSQAFSCSEPHMVAWSSG